MVAWARYGLGDYSPIEDRLPVVENVITQVAPGPFVVGASIVSNTEVTLIHSLVEPRSVGIAALKQGFTGFFIPLRWAGDLWINGVIATPTAIHMPVEDVSIHIRGGQREQIACLLPRAQFVETVAALRGAGPDTLALQDRSLELAPEASRRLRRCLANILVRGRCADPGVTSHGAPLDLTSQVLELMVDAYLQARPAPKPRSGRVRNASRIVRAAEERFAQADRSPVSLADLCAAAGVSKSALYLAFQSWCGEPPIAYFHKRRLTKARAHLLRADPERGVVTRAASSVGLTELGRFSRDYRRLFGEPPSITLGRSVV